MGAGSTALHRLRAPRTWARRPADLAALTAGNGLLIGATWIRHGQRAELHSWPGILRAARQLSALYGTHLVLPPLILVLRQRGDHAADHLTVHAHGHRRDGLFIAMGIGSVGLAAWLLVEAHPRFAAQATTPDDLVLWTAGLDAHLMT